MQETFSLAHLQLSHLNNLHENVKMHFLMSTSVSHHLRQYVSVFKDRYNHPHVDGSGIFMLLSQPFHTQPACKAERFICCIKPERDIIIERKSGAGDLKKLFNHQCLNTFAQDNILKLENFRFYIFDLLLFLLGHYLAR